MKLVLKIIIFLIPLLSISAVVDNETVNNFHYKKLASPIELIESQWIDSLMTSMTIEEKVSQLFMIPVYSGRDDNYEKLLIAKLKKVQPGGVILMKGEPYAHAKLTNTLQEFSNIPLMVAVDGEWGLAMRMDSVISFPKAMALGAIKNDQLVFDLGYEIASHCNRLGIHINFAPVVDINNRYNNPIINIRAFGDNKFNVARKGLAYSIGMQNNGVLAVGKHFPGHGSTITDSHKTLPTINKSKKQLYENELYPFNSLIQNELGGVMVAHIAVPAIDDRPNRPASLSSNVIDTILKKELGFKGLVFTDALNMKGVTRDYEHGQIEVEALLAGNDVLLYPENLEVGIRRVTEAVKNGVISEKQINEKCFKILKAKKWFGLDTYKQVELDNLLDDINTTTSKQLNQKLVEESITLIHNKNSLLPLNNLGEKRILYVSMGNKSSNTFQNYLIKYARVDTLSCSNQPSKAEIKNILDTVTNYTHVVIGQHGVSQWTNKRFKLTDANINLAVGIAELKPTILGFFGNPYALRYYENLNQFDAVIIGYSNSYLYKKHVAQAIFGGIGVNGVLPISISDNFSSGSGKFYEATRLKYTEPYEFGFTDTAFNKVDSIIKAAINMKATPGCQIIYAKDGKVIYEKNFGYYTYNQDINVESDAVYDIASITKVAATTVSLMHLYENDKLDLTAKLSKYLGELKHTDKKSIRINKILSHQSGLHSWIPFYKNTLDDDGNYRGGLYLTDSSENHNIKVAHDLYLRNDYRDSIFQAIIDTPLYRKKKYRYSDLGFYWMAELIKHNTGNSIEQCTQEWYYSNLGMNYTMYNPWRYDKDFSLVPSENDLIFRKQIVKGYVHDPGAAMLGGVSGHAGLFSNANDLVKLGQLFLNNGTYGGEYFFSPKTLKVFNKSYYKRKGNRRALGFDKPALHKDDVGPTCESVSQQSFGHSGFTGSYMWIDPENNSVYIFLSNRTFPNQENKKLVEMDVRTKIHQVFYDVFEH